jgi:hypothetical protein
MSVGKEEIYEVENVKKRERNCWIIFTSRRGDQEEWIL